MAVTATNGRIGPAVVLKSGTDIGGTMGSVDVTLRVTDTPLKFDQLGTEPADLARVGFGANAVLPRAEITMPAWGDILVGETTVTSGTKKRISCTGVIGQMAQRDSLWSKYIVKPMKAGVADTDANEWITFPRGFGTPNTTLSFTVDGQRVVPVTVEGLPDTGASNVRVIFGDETA